MYVTAELLCVLEAGQVTKLLSESEFELVQVSVP